MTNMQTDPNTTSSSKKVTDLELQIRVIKYRSRSCLHNIPFKHTHKVIRFYMLMNCALWINVFPPEVGFYTSVSLRTIFTGLKSDYYKQFRIIFPVCTISSIEHSNQQPIVQDVQIYLFRPRMQPTRWLHICLPLYWMQYHTPNMKVPP